MSEKISLLWSGKEDGALILLLFTEFVFDILSNTVGETSVPEICLSAFLQILSSAKF
jgi:hypothetical protein